jgi:hypothetical protein
MSEEKLYTLIGYKPDSEDICRGCVMGRFGSDFIYEQGLSEGHAADLIAEIQSRKRSVGEAPWDLYLLRYLPDEDEDIGRIYQSALKEGDRRAEEREHREALAKIEAERKHAAAKADSERAEYERLRAKYETEAK